MRLYDLSEQYNDLLDVLEGSEDQAAVQAMLDGIDDAFDVKVESIVRLMRSKQAERDAINTEQARLAMRSLRTGKEIDWLHDYVQREMVRTGKEQVKSSLFDIKFGLCPPAVNVLDERVIPTSYFVTKPAVTTLDRRSLLEDLKAGETIPGAEMIQRKTLRIK